MTQRYQVIVDNSIYQVVVANTAVGSQLSRAGHVTFQAGTSQVVVSFPTPLPGVVGNYALVGILQNTLDPFPMDLIAQVSAFSVNGFTVRVNAPVDSGNYSFNWAVVGIVNG